MSYRNSKLNPLALAILAISSALPNLAHAQLVLEEVIVTAQKKEQTLSEAPLTVNVISAEEIREFNMFEATDLGKLTAGLEVRNEGDSNTGVALRGVGTLTQQATPARVGIYLDGWYAGAQSNFVFKQMFDMQRVQVLRGPQGTLYGQPSPTGALILETADPNLYEIEGFVTGSYQDPTGYNLQGAVSIPLIENQLAVRVALLSDERETGLKNIVRDEENEVSNDGYRVKLLWEPGDNFSGKLSWTHVESKKSDTYRPLESITSEGNFQLDASDRTSIQDAPDRMDSQETDLYSLNLNWDVGPVELTLFASTLDNLTESISDQDATDEPLQTLSLRTKGLDDKQLEFRMIASPFEWWDTQVGYYYSKVANQTDVPIFFNSPESGFVANIFLDIPTSTVINAAFTHNDFYLTDDTTLTVGLRYNEFDNKAENNQTIQLLIGSTILPGGEITEPVAVIPVACPDGSDAPCEVAVGEVEKEWTGTVKIAHAFNDDHNLYATYDSGYRPGAPNFDTTGTVPESQLSYGGESVNSVEVGLKGTLMNGRAQYTAAAYYSLYEDYQVIPSYQVWNERLGMPSDINVVYVNVDEAEQLGIEGEFRILLTENWSMFTSLAWSQVEFTDGVIPCNDPSQPPLSADNPFNVCDAKGGVAGAQPDWSLVLQSEYWQTLAAIDGEWFVNGLFNYRGESEVPGDAGGRLSTDDYYQLDLFAGLRNETWTAKLYVINVLDDDDITSKRAAGPNYNDISIIRPRTTGITLSYRF